jgi:dCMP deaminase
MARPTWDTTFIELCYTIAERSKDRSTKIGCVIIGPNKELRSMGYNGMRRGCNDMEHGERNAIYNAARMGAKLEGCSLYVLGPPCADCARAIIQSGIIEVICASIDAPLDHKDNCEASLEMLKEASIMIRLPDTSLGIPGWNYVNKTGWGSKRCRP